MSLAKTIEVLRHLNIFAGFEPEALRLLAFAASEGEFRGGDVIFHQGDNLDAAYLIVSGAIVLHADGGGSRKGKVVGPGALVGARALLTEIKASCAATANGDLTTIRISRELLLRVLVEFPASATSIKKAILQEIKDLGVEISRVRDTLADGL